MALPNSAASIDALLSQMASMRGQLAGSSFTPPSSYQGYQSQGAAIGNIGYTPAITTGNWNFSAADFPSLVSPKAATSGWKPDLIGMINGTLGQPVGYITSMVDKALNIGKKDFSQNKPWYQNLGDFMNDASPANIIGGTLADGISAGVGKVGDNWKDGHLSWGDIPPIGFLNGMANSWKHGSDILSDSGVQNQWTKTLGGLGIDITLDPLTYLTGGLSAASKAGKVAEATKIGELASQAGVTGKVKNMDSLLNTSIDSMRATHAQKAEEIANATRQQYAAYPNLSEKMAQTAKANYTNLSDKLIAKKVEDMQHAVELAKNTAFNQNVNSIALGLPKVNKTIKLADQPKWSPMYRSEATLGATNAHIADNLLHQAAMGDSSLKDTLSKVVQARYGVNSIEDLTKSHLSDLSDKLSPLIKGYAKTGNADFTVAQKVVESVLPKADFDNLMAKFTKDNVPWKDVQKQLDQILQQTAHDPALRSSVGSQLAKMVEDYWTTKPAKNFSGAANARKAESMGWASRFLSGSDKVQSVEHTITSMGEATGNRDVGNLNKVVRDLLDNKYSGMNDAKTKFEHLLDRKSPFNARTLKTGDAYVNSMANHIADASSQRVGETAMYSRPMNDIRNFIKKNNVSDDEMKQVIYHLENHAPDSLGGTSWKASDKVKQLADMVKPILNSLGKGEQAAGTLGKTTDNYFPHVLNKNLSPEEAKSINDFMEKHPELKSLAGNSSKNVFDQTRNSFKTMAEKDNYIAKLEKAIQSEKDPDTIETLRKQLDHVANLFDTNVVSSLTRRIQSGVRAKSMKAMQGELSKFGMLKSVDKAMANDPSVSTKGLTEIDAATAKRLGLDTEKTHYIQEDVLKGMKRMDEIFTQEGMKTFVRHMNAISDIWRPLVTNYKPSHFRNNLIGNAMINMAAGVKVGDYLVARKLIKGFKNGTLNDAQMKIMESAYKHNVISSGFMMDGLQSYKFDDPTKLEKLAKMVSDNKYTRFNRKLGDYPDDITRLANYVNGLDKFGNSGKAAAQVREYLFNYNELTNADRGMRTVVPFWNWIKNNVPLQMKMLMDNPKFAMNTNRFYQLFNSNANVSANQSYLTDTNNYIKVPFTDNTFTTWQSPTNDLNNVLNPLSMLGSTAPAIKMPIEMAMNKKFFTGKPISYGSPTVQPQDLPAYVASNAGIGGDIYNMLSGKKNPIEALLNLINPTTQAKSVGQGGN